VQVMHVLEIHLPKRGNIRSPYCIL